VNSVILWVAAPLENEENVSLLDRFFLLVKQTHFLSHLIRLYIIRCFRYFPSNCVFALV